ncbi:MAG: preprotein translocase subunit SecE [Candidatus Eisenbacteria bacterium]
MAAAEQALVPRFRRFLGDAKIELSKVSWPNREELRESTTVVLIAVFLISMLIYVVDILISKVIQFIL